MNSSEFGSDQFGTEDRTDRDRSDNQFKKLKRPEHASKRSKTPERLRGIHRRRRKRMEW
jgi:hypothetical protein